MGTLKVVNEEHMRTASQSLGFNFEKARHRAAEAEKLIFRAVDTLPADKALDVVAWAILASTPKEILVGRAASVLAASLLQEKSSLGLTTLALPAQTIERANTPEFQDLNNADDLYNKLIDMAMFKVANAEFNPTAIFVTNTHLHFLDMTKLFAEQDGGSDAGKDLAVAIMRSTAKNYGSELQGLCFVSEVWYSPATPSSHTSQLVAPSKHPNRKEALMFNLEWTGQHPTMRLRPFLRDKEGTILFEQEANIGGGDATHTGRFDNLMGQDLPSC